MVVVMVSRPDKGFDPPEKLFERLRSLKGGFPLEKKGDPYEKLPIIFRFYMLNSGGCTRYISQHPLKTENL